MKTEPVVYCIFVIVSFDRKEEKKEKKGKFKLLGLAQHIEFISFKTKLLWICSRQAFNQLAGQHFPVISSLFYLKY